MINKKHNLTDLEQKVILNSYDVFPIKYVEGDDVNAKKRTAYIKGGIDAIKMYEDSLEEVFDIPPVEISDGIIETWAEIMDSSEGTKGGKPGKLF